MSKWKSSYRKEKLKFYFNIFFVDKWENGVIDRGKKWKI